MLDAALVPFMKFIQGCGEEPQRTHRWNNKKFRTAEERAVLNRSIMLSVPGDPTAFDRRRYCSWWSWVLVLIFHIPILGGWREYVVLAPEDHHVGEWMPGWWAGNAVGVSRLRIRGPVRLLRGPSETLFFGVDAHGCQIRLREIGRGRIGQGGPFAHLPLR